MKLRRNSHNYLQLKNDEWERWMIIAGLYDFSNDSHLSPTSPELTGSLFNNATTYLSAYSSFVVVVVAVDDHTFFHPLKPLCLSEWCYERKTSRWKSIQSLHLRKNSFCQTRLEYIAAFDRLERWTFHWKCCSFTLIVAWLTQILPRDAVTQIRSHQKAFAGLSPVNFLFNNELC